MLERMSASAGSCAACACARRFSPPLNEDYSCIMAQGRVGPGRRRHLPTIQNDGHQIPDQICRLQTTREEIMSGIWLWPKPKPGPAMGSGRRTTTSTPNIISERCPQTQARHKVRRPRCLVFAGAISGRRGSNGYRVVVDVDRGGVRIRCCNGRRGFDQQVCCSSRRSRSCRPPRPKASAVIFAASVVGVDLSQSIV